jgi:hypothetical protein
MRQQRGQHANNLHLQASPHMQTASSGPAAATLGTCAAHDSMQLIPALQRVLQHWPFPASGL